MNFFKRQIKTIGLLLILILLFFNLNFWFKNWLGWILFVSYLSLLGDYWQVIFRKVLLLSKKLWVTKIFAYLSVFLLLSFTTSIFVVFNKLDLFLVWFSYVVVMVLTLIIFYLVNNSKKIKPALSDVSDDNLVIFKKIAILPIVYFILWTLAFYFLYISKSIEILRSPWQTISEYYLLIFFVLTLFSGIFLFAKYKTKTILFIFLFQSILLHLYIPMSHQLPWGGDVWRHIANEKILIQGEQILPVLIGQDAQWVEVVGVDIPEVFIKPHKYTYGQLWGSTILLSQTLQLDLIILNRWLVPILWSITMPFILFRIGWLIFGSVRRGLWLPWFMFLAFPFQAWGGLTLPVSLGFITFLLAFMLWLQYLRDGNKALRNLVLFFACLMLFGYSLYFILIWLVILFSFAIKYLPKSTVPKNISKYSLLFLSVFIFPVIELISKISFIPEKVEWWFGLKQIIGRFSGFFYAQLIRPHDILGGNVLFNHTPDYAFVQNIFNAWRWWLIPFMLIMIGLAKFGVFKFFKSKKQMHQLILFLTPTVVGGYVIGWFVLTGDRLFTRRLELIFAFFWIVLIIYSLQKLLTKWRAKDLVIKIGIVICLIIFSWFGTMAYASGPDDRVVSVNEYEVAQKVFQSISESSGACPERSRRMSRESCVLGDTWLLLALEGVSSGEIVGGGFPIDYQFGQKERVEMFEKFAKYPEADDLVQMKKLTDADKCTIVYEDTQGAFLFGNNLDIEIVNRINEIMDVEVQKVGNLLIWEEGLKEEVE